MNKSGTAVMTVGPYQSKLLRFALRQFREGMARHHRAVRSTGMAISTGVALGAAYTVLPVYAAIKTSAQLSRQFSRQLSRQFSRQIARQVSRRLEVAAQSSDLLTLESVSSPPASPTSLQTSLPKQRAALIEISGFEAEALTPSLAPSLAPSTAEDEASKGATETGKQLLTLGIAERSMVQMLRTVARELLPSQIKWLAQRGDPRRGQIAEQAGLPLKVQALSNWLPRRLLGGPLVKLLTREPNSLPLAWRITGVASDLQTRSLVLVLGYRTAWNILSVEQQSQLQKQINGWLAGENLGLARPPLRRQVGTRVALLKGPFSLAKSTLAKSTLAKSTLAKSTLAKSTLAKSTARSIAQSTAQSTFSLTVKSARFLVTVVWWLIVWVLSTLTSYGLTLERQATALPIRGLRAGRFLNQQKGETQQGIRVSQVKNIREKQEHFALAGAMAAPPQKIALERPSVFSDSSDPAPYWDTEVLSVDYIAHPLERLLKWVDRCLLWLENLWQQLLAKLFATPGQ